MIWRASLSLQHRLDESGRCVVRHEHDGPLRVLHALYPEGPAICHQVVIHPPGGIVGGDQLDIQLQLEGGAHALVTTPGATRFYRCEGGLLGQQTVRARLADGARLEWVPGETIAYTGCDAHNALSLDLAPSAQALVWDVLALGLPAAKAPFASGRIRQHLQLTGAWLERATIDAADERLLNSPLGLAGRSCMASLAFASGHAWPAAMRDALLDAARAVLDAFDARHPPDWRAPETVLAGATAPQAQVIVVRVLGPATEPVMQRLRAIRLRWRQLAWGVGAIEPRVWAT